MLRPSLALAVAALLLSGCFAATSRTTRDERTATLPPAEEKWYLYRFDGAVDLRYSFTSSGPVSTYVLHAGDVEAFGRGETPGSLAAREQAKQGEASATLAPGAYAVALRCDGPAACTFRLLVQAEAAAAPTD